MRARLDKRKQLGNLRTIRVANEYKIDLASNDYLGLARSSLLKQQVLEKWQKREGKLTGLGSTGSRLLTGSCNYGLELEESIARFHGFETGSLFGCGYMANVGLLSTIAKPNATLLLDAGCHASMKDGAILARARTLTFRHNDLDHLEKRLKGCQETIERFICVEALYSTDGSLAPLEEICALAEKYSAHVVVDEAHSIGLFGPAGKGLVAEKKLCRRIFALVATFGKALGCYGAIVLGNKELKSALLNFATPYIYTTAPPLLALIAIKCSYAWLPFLNHERCHLAQLVQYFQKLTSSLSSTQIQPIYIKGNEAVKNAAERLVSQGFEVRSLLSPTVRKGQEQLRICLHSFNNKEEVEKMFAFLVDLL